MKNQVVKIENYNLKAANGRHIRVATKAIMSDGSVIRFMEKFSKKEVINQLAK